MFRGSLSKLFLIGSGAPTKKEIHDGFIGQLGYSTWRDFCTTELKLTQSTWHAWAKADKVV